MNGFKLALFAFRHQSKNQEKRMKKKESNETKRRAGWLEKSKSSQLINNKINQYLLSALVSFLFPA